jgi:hypothetical protein
VDDFPQELVAGTLLMEPRDVAAPGGVLASVGLIRTKYRDEIAVRMATRHERASIDEERAWVVVDSGKVLGTVSRGPVDRDFWTDEDHPETAFHLYKLIVARKPPDGTLGRDSWTGHQDWPPWKVAIGCA